MGEHVKIPAQKVSVGQRLATPRSLQVSASQRPQNAPAQPVVPVRVHPFLYGFMKTLIVLFRRWFRL